MAEMHRNIQEGVGYEGTDEYVPLGADAYEVKQDARRVTFEGPGPPKFASPVGPRSPNSSPRV